MWFILGILSGLFHALMSMVSKRALRDTNRYLVAFAYAAFSLPFLIISLLWLGLASVNLTFWWATIASSVLSVIALLLFMKALSIGELSLTVPFLSFTPIFLIFTSQLMLGEAPSAVGILGVVSIVAGAYIIELKEEKGVFGPFKALGKNRGAQLVSIVAFIYAISSNFNKIAILNSNPITYLVWVQITSTLIYIPLIYFKSDQKFGEIKSRFKFLLPIGVLVALSLLCQMTAVNLGLVAYVISLKRTSALFSVILGFVAFRERNIKPRLIGSLLMVLGVLLISQG